MQNDEEPVPTDLDMDLVEKQLKGISPDTLKDLAGRVNAQMARSADQSTTLGKMDDAEFRTFVKKNLGFHSRV